MVERRQWSFLRQTKEYWKAIVMRMSYDYFRRMKAFIAILFKPFDELEEDKVRVLLELDVVFAFQCLLERFVRYVGNNDKVKYTTKYS